MAEPINILEPTGAGALKQAIKAPFWGTSGTTLRNLPVAFAIGKEFRHAARNRVDYFEGDRQLMRLIHGDHALDLGDKSRFPSIVRSIGYTAPDSFLVTSETPEEDIQNFIDTQKKSVFIKPLNGTWQRDASVYPIDDSLLPSIKQRQKQESTLVQENRPHEKVLRYIRYKAKDGNIYSACFSYDEVHDEKRKNISVPIVGKKTAFSAAGVSVNEYTTSVYNSLANPLTHGEFRTINAFMEPFMAALEDKLNGKIDFISCDIGLQNKDLLMGEYDEEKLKSGLIFFETQTIPQPWEVRELNTSRPLQTYMNLWNLFMKEHRSDMLRRAKEMKLL